MNQYVTGAVIRQLREKNKMTQFELAEKLCVSDKTISKWETGKGYPDISLLEPIARVFGISVAELMAGDAVTNGNVSANIMRSLFYVCPVCGNIIHCMGEAVVHCHGVQLTPCQPEQPAEGHIAKIEKIEDEFFIEFDHAMTKQHYISFIAVQSSDSMQITRLYPEGPAYTRFNARGVKRVLFYCNQDGLFVQNINRKL